MRICFRTFLFFEIFFGRIVVYEALFVGFAETARAGCVRDQRFVQIFIGKIRKHFIGKIQFRIGALPEQEVGKPELFSRADNEIGIGQPRSVEKFGNIPFGNRSALAFRFFRRFFEKKRSLFSSPHRLIDKKVNDVQHAAISRAEQDEWLAELMQTYGDDILRLCYVILQDRALAEDASQEVFLKAYKRLHTLRERKYAKTWLVSIAVNTCRDQLRAAWLRHTDRSVSLEDLPPAACDFTEQDDSVLREVMALEPKYREVLLLHYYQNMDAAECARALRITVSGFYRRLKKAQARLKPELERWGLNER